MNRYEGPLAVGMILTAPDNDGVLGFRRVRIVGKHVDGGWIIEDLPSRMRTDRSPRRISAMNLRIVFVPEPPEQPGDSNVGFGVVIDEGAEPDDLVVLGNCEHGVNLDREFCSYGCRR